MMWLATSSRVKDKQGLINSSAGCGRSRASKVVAEFRGMANGVGGDSGKGDDEATHDDTC